MNDELAPEYEFDYSQAKPNRFATLLSHPVRFPEPDAVDALKREWTDKLVRVKTEGRADLTRFARRVGRVVTINYSGRAVVDFGDGGWYDVADFAAVLDVVTDEAEAGKYDAAANSAQKFPARQG